MNMPHPKRSCFRGLVGIVLVTLYSGCSKLSTEYGLSEGADARQSPASVSAFRNLCDSQGCQTKEIQSLSPRAMEQLEGIVWTPDHYGDHKLATFEWMNKWLGKGDRTLIYVGRDFSPMADYWRQSAEAFSANEVVTNDSWNSLELKAEAETLLDRKRAAVREMVATPWFLFDYTSFLEKRVKAVTGPWAEEIDAEQARFFLRGEPLGLNQRSSSQLKKIFDREAEASSSTVIVSPTGKIPVAGAPTTVPGPRGEYDFRWNPSDAEMLKVVKGISEEDEMQFDVLLATDQQQPLIAEITNDAWNRSRVIVLANSSIVSNVSMINEQNRSVAKRLIAKLPNQAVGFLTGPDDPPIRKDDNLEQQKGFEMLTIWPLNVITLHAVFLGILALVSLFPIFGRAKRLPEKSTLNFGSHVDAVGALLYKSRDRFYALATIGDYFRLVRKEPTSPWANVDQKAQQDPTSPFSS